MRLPEPYGLTEVFSFVVGDSGIATRPLTITRGLREYLPNWHVELATNEIVLNAGQTSAIAVITITPPADPRHLPIDGGPIADVPAFVNGELIGGIRKVWRPPVPLGQLGEPGYAESEISIDPDPPVAGQPTTFAAEVRSNSDFTQTINLQFGWADFGVGISFSNTGVVPTQTMVTLAPHMTATVSAQWTPDKSGHYCVQINLFNEQTQEALHSQRNVDVIEGPPCEPFALEFWLYNSTPLVVTATLGAKAFNLPPGWEFSIDPEDVVLGPYEGITVTVTITPFCDLAGKGALPLQAAQDDGSSPVKIQVEGYDQTGDLIGGVELQLVAATQNQIYLPLITRLGSGGAQAISPRGMLPAENPARYGIIWQTWLWLLVWGGVSLLVKRMG